MNFYHKSLSTIFLLFSFACANATPGDRCMPEAHFDADAAFEVVDVMDVHMNVTLARSIPIRRDIALLPLDNAGEHKALREHYQREMPLPAGSLDRAASFLQFTHENSRLRLRKDNKEYILEPDAAAAIGATPRSGSDLMVSLPPRTIIEAVNGYGQAAAGSVLNVGLSPGVAVSFSQPMFLRMVPAQVRNSALLADDIARAKPGTAISLRVRQANFDFRTQAVTFCFQDQSVPGRPYVASTKVEFLKQEGDVGYFSATLPTTIEPQLHWEHWRQYLNDLGTPLAIRAIASSDTDVLLDANADFVVAWFGFALPPLLAFGALFVFFGRRLGNQGEGPAALAHLLLGPDGQYSLSNLQTFLWAVLVMFSICYVWAMSGRLVALEEGMLILLGISGTASVTVKGLENRDGAVAAAPTAETSPTPRFTSLLNKPGESALLRFQLLGFTVLTLFYVLIEVLRQQKFPEIPPSFYALMGVSNVTYLGGKMMGGAEGADKATDKTNPPSSSPMSRDQLLQLQSLLAVAQTGADDAATRTAAKAYKTAQGLVPDDDSLTPELLRKLQRESQGK